VIVRKSINLIRHGWKTEFFCPVQRENVTIDACILSKTDSSLFQQGCLLSKGFYFRPRMLDMLLQYLLVRIDTVCEQI